MSEQSQETNGTNSVSDLTPEQVRRKLAEALGWRVESTYFPVSDSTGYALVTKEGKAATRGYNYWNKDAAWLDCPDWTTDPAVALALCLEIAREHGWYITISDMEQWTSPDGVEVPACTFVRLYKPRCDAYEYAASAPTPAEALARLALAALQGGAGS